MPKMKTHSGAKKRFTVTGSGKIRRLKANKSHILTKGSQAEAGIAPSTYVETNGEIKRIKRLIQREENRLCHALNRMLFA